MRMANARRLHVGGHTDGGGAAIALVVTKPIVTADISAAVARLSAHASEHAVADREGVVHL
jgi:hypothetical protein